jgi:hypothetical protein
MDEAYHSLKYSGKMNLSFSISSCFHLSVRGMMLNFIEPSSALMTSSASGRARSPKTVRATCFASDALDWRVLKTSWAVTASECGRQES